MISWPTCNNFFRKISCVFGLAFHDWTALVMFSSVPWDVRISAPAELCLSEIYDRVPTLLSMNVTLCGKSFGDAIEWKMRSHYIRTCFSPTTGVLIRRPSEDPGMQTGRGSWPWRQRLWNDAGNRQKLEESPSESLEGGDPAHILTLHFFSPEPWQSKFLLV